MKKNIKKISSAVAGFLLSAFYSGFVFSDELLVDQDLLSKPNIHADVVGAVKKGNVKVLERKGFWVQISAGDVTGWTKISTIKAESASSEFGLTDTGRAASGNIVATSGVRGLDGKELEQAQPDYTEFDKLISQEVTNQQGISFASEVNLKTRKIVYIEDSIL